MNLVYQAAVSVLNVIAPNAHTMPTSSSQIWGTLTFQLLGSKLATVCVFSLSEILSGASMIGHLPLHFDQQMKYAPLPVNSLCEHVARY